MPLPFVTALPNALPWLSHRSPGGCEAVQLREVRGAGEGQRQGAVEKIGGTMGLLSHKMWKVHGEIRSEHDMCIYIYMYICIMYIYAYYIYIHKQW